MEVASVAITTLLTLIEGLLPELGLSNGANIINQILNALIALVPIVTANAQDFITPVKNIISALQTIGAVTPAQMTALQELDAQCDAAFDAAATAAGGV